jgi:tRNA-specific 2-thiouridylase
VVRIDAGKNALVVGEKKDLLQCELTAENVNWIENIAPGVPFEAKVRIRYRHKEAGAGIEPLENDRMRVRFDSPQSAVTPGQAAVVYRGETVVGGGWIE